MKKQNTQPGFPSGSLSNEPTAGQIMQERRAVILYEVATGHGDLTDEVIAELAELINEMDGSDTSLQTQLFDSGFYGDRF